MLVVKMLTYNFEWATLEQSSIQQCIRTFPAVSPPSGLRLSVEVSMLEKIGTNTEEMEAENCQSDVLLIVLFQQGFPKTMFNSNIYFSKFGLFATWA